MTEMEMSQGLLTSYWIFPTDPRGPLGYGVTAYSLDDAIQIIRHFGYKLPEDIYKNEVIENVTIAELDSPYVRDNMGPIVVRGLWYPFRRVGL